MTTTASPITFDSIIGQERARGVLRSAISSGRVHHAWLFTGPPGVGKRTAAAAFAGVLLDPTTAPNLAGEYEPDPASEVQHLLATGAHPDMHVITKELALYSDDAKVRSSKQITIPKDVIETHLLEPIERAPSMWRPGSLMNKFFLIDEAELLDRSVSNAPTQNSMLKTLEEPPEGSIIVMVTSREDRLLPTIRSRCQRVTFRRLDDASMAAWFERAGLDLPPDERAWVERFAAGSPGRVMLAVETGLFEWGRQLGPMLESAAAGRYEADLGPTMASLIESWASSWVDSHRNASKEAANHAGARCLFALLDDWARTHLRASVDASSPTYARWLRVSDLLQDAERQITTNVQLAMALEDLSVRMSGADRL